MKTLKSMRLHIGIFGKTNVGKSSLLNRITNQDISIVSDIAGTTTDVVEKSMELLPIGPVNFLDTAGIDDKTALSSERIEKTMKILNRTDVAVVVCDYNGIDEYEIKLIKKFDELKIPYIIVVNKIDEKPLSDAILADLQQYTKNILITSATSDNDLVYKFKETLVKLLPDDFVNMPKIVSDLVPKKALSFLLFQLIKKPLKAELFYRKSKFCVTCWIQVA